jgi:DnaA-homolog protein
MRQLALSVRLRAHSVFDGFFPGPNAAAVAQLRALTVGTPPVVWLCGPMGSGKTHLLQAVCAAAGARGQTATYLPLRDARAHGAEWLAGCETLEYVCLDDFAAVAGDATWEHAVFRLYTGLEDRGGRLLVSALGPAPGLNIKLADLASRLAAGTLLRLQPLNDEQQLAALQLRARQLGMELPTDAAQWLVRRLPRDMASLCATLDDLDRVSLAEQRRLTLAFVRRCLESQPSA